VPTIRKTVGVLLGLAVAAVFVFPTASAADPSDQSYVKYYVVQASYQGRPETLDDIASRFLGAPARSGEILALNSARVQPDGGTLTDPAKLHAGWALALPWDAHGDGVRYGLLPTAAPTSPAPSQPAIPKQPADPGTAQCASTGRPADGNQNQWGVLRIAPDKAWPYSRGAGVLVAVADSGVDASLPALSGRTTAGADIVSGTGRGNTDCLGTGTAMASIIAARTDAGGSVTGIAPEATILPVRLVTGTPDARPVDQAAAIEVATAAGARVIALGGYVTPADPAVVAAIASVTSHDVVVVMAAPAGTAVSPSASPAATPDAGVLRVGAVGIDGRPAAAYAPGSVDVVAPGVAVAALGISGAGQLEVTGPQYAVSFVAGEVALVRARFPKLTAAQVVHRVKATADPIGGAAGVNGFGAGLIDPGLSVTRVIAEENPAAPPPADQPAEPHPFRLEALLIVGGLALVTVLLVLLRMRRIIRPDPPADAELTTPAADPHVAGIGGSAAAVIRSEPTQSSTVDVTVAHDARPAEAAAARSAAGLQPVGRRAPASLWDEVDRNGQS
jgi:membrane-anchored mycosin MYCP